MANSQRIQKVNELLKRELGKIILKELDNPQEAFFFAEHKDRVIGTILVSHDGRKGWINRLAVIPEYRDKGLAAKLIETAEKFLSEQNIEIFACLIEEWNKSSKQLFQKLGYKRTDDIIYYTKKKHLEV